VLAAEAAALGINWTLTPVLDINAAHRSAIVATRSFGSDVGTIEAHALACVAAFQAAGLAATGEARRLGLDCVLLEAKDRIGGRAWTDSAALGWPFDYGCQWLHSASINPLREAADRLGFAYLVPEDGRFGVHDGTGFVGPVERRAARAALEAFLERAAAAGREGRDLSRAEFLDPADPWTPLIRQWYAIFAAHEVEDLSTVELANETWTDENYPVVEGYGALIARLGADIPVRLATPVSVIDLSGPLVSVETPAGRLEARAVVLTVSTAVLAAEAIAIRPHGLPDWKRRAIEVVPMGSGAKIGLAFDPAVAAGWDESFWITTCDPGGGSFGLFLRPAGNPGAVGFIGGRHGHELALAGDAAIYDYVDQRLAAIFGNGLTGKVRARTTHAWDRDPHVLGAYSGCRPGHGNARQELARPVDDRLFFAGEACSTPFPATAHGAHLTGIEAARAVAAAMVKR